MPQTNYHGHIELGWLAFHIFCRHVIVWEAIYENVGKIVKYFMKIYNEHQQTQYASAIGIIVGPVKQNTFS